MNTQLLKASVGPGPLYTTGSETCVNPGFSWPQVRWSVHTHLSQRNSWCHWLQLETLELWIFPAAGVLKKKEQHKQTVNVNNTRPRLHVATGLTDNSLPCLSLSFPIFYSSHSWGQAPSWNLKRALTMNDSWQLAQILRYMQSLMPMNLLLGLKENSINYFFPFTWVTFCL